MSGRIRYTEEFKREAVAQVTERGHSVTSVAERIGVSSKSLYDWVRQFGVIQVKMVKMPPRSGGSRLNSNV